MSDGIKIVCPKCNRSTITPRCDYDPLHAVELHGIVCQNCDNGEFDMPEYIDKNGNYICEDPHDKT